MLSAINAKKDVRPFMIHSMKLNPEPFELIKSGKKTIELRLYDEKRRAVRVGDALEFTCTVSGEVLLKRVKALHVFASFAELYAALPLEKCGYTEENIVSASPSDMEKYYSREEQAGFGVVGIELE